MRQSRFADPSRFVPAIILLLSLIAIGVLTLIPGSREMEGPGWACLFCSTFGIADALLNVFLFMPLGFSLRLLKTTTMRAIAVGFICSAFVEAAQFVVVPGRDASIGDLITNTLGSGLGYSLAASETYWFRATRMAARTLSLFYAIGIAVAVVLCGYLLRPSFTESDYFGQWTPDLGHLERYDGQVLDARIGSQFLPPERLDETGRFRDAWASGTPIRIRALAGSPPPGLAPLFSIYDGEQREILIVGVDGHDLVFRHRTKAIAIKLRQPLVRLRSTMDEGDTGDTLRLSVEVSGAGHCVTLNGNRFCNRGFSIGEGWKLLLGGDYVAPTAEGYVGLVLLFVVFLPLGFWTGRSPAAAVFAAASISILIIMPRHVGLASTSLLESFACGIGLAAGLIGGRMYGRRLGIEESPES